MPKDNLPEDYVLNNLERVFDGGLVQAWNVPNMKGEPTNLYVLPPAGMSIYDANVEIGKCVQATAHYLGPDYTEQDMIDALQRNHFKVLKPVN